VPKKVRWLARRSAYNARAGEGAVLLFEPLGLEEYKTKRIISLLERTGVSGNVLILTDGNQPHLHVSARNIPRVQVRPFGQESAYDVLWSDTVLIETTALERAAEVAHA
jgi:large subunit ribosomal protein L4